MTARVCLRPLDLVLSFLVVVVVVAMTVQPTGSEQTSSARHCTSRELSEDCPDKNCCLLCQGECPPGYVATTSTKACQPPATTTPTTIATAAAATATPGVQPLTKPVITEVLPIQPVDGRKKRGLESYRFLEHSLINAQSPDRSTEWNVVNGAEHAMQQETALYLIRHKRQVAPATIPPQPQPKPPLILVTTTTLPPTTTTAAAVTTAATTAPQVKCIRCSVDNCSICKPSAGHECQQCKAGFKLTDHNQCTLIDNDDDGLNLSIIVGGSVGGVALLIIVAIIIIIIVCMKRRGKDELSGGCSLDLVTAERIPSSAREPSENTYGNVPVEEHKSSKKKKISQPQTAGDQRRGTIQSIERNEIYELGVAPTPPQLEKGSTENYDALDLKSQEPAMTYTPLAFQDDTVVYENASAIQQQNGNTYINTNFCPDDKGVGSQPNLCVKSKIDRRSAKDDVIDYHQPPVHDRREDIIPPPYDSNSVKNKSPHPQRRQQQQQEQQQQQQHSNQQQELQEDDTYEDPDPLNNVYNNETTAPKSSIGAEDKSRHNQQQQQQRQQQQQHDKEPIDDTYEESYSPGNLYYNEDISLTENVYANQ